MKTHRAILVLAFLAAAACGGDRRALVVGKVQQVSKLATTEFTIDKLVHGTKDKRLFWVFRLNQARFLAYSRAIVKTGINLKKLKHDDIRIEGASIQITLPPIEVINFSYPPEAFRFDHRISQPERFMNKIGLTDQEEYFRSAEIDIRNSLEHMGIVETTQEKTRTLLVALLKNLGYEEIHIGFQSDALIVDRVPSELTEVD